MISPTVTAAWIGLAGTLVTVGLGYWQWRRQTTNAKPTPFELERREAHKELWDRVEQVHLELRRTPQSGEVVTKGLTDVNSFLLRNEMYFDDDLRPLVGRYISALGMVTTSIAQSDDEDAKSDMDATAAFSIPSGEQTEAALKTATELRERILGICRGVVRGR